MANPSMTYAGAGVSIDSGNELVERIKIAIATTKRPGADAEISGFGGTIDLQAAGYDKVLILVQAADGVGTKLKIPFAMNEHDTVGIDLAEMKLAYLLPVLAFASSIKATTKDNEGQTCGIAAGRHWAVDAFLAAGLTLGTHSLCHLALLPRERQTCAWVSIFTSSPIFAGLVHYHEHPDFFDPVLVHFGKDLALEDIGNEP